MDLGIYLVDDLLVKTDRMSMAHSLEARVPFLDTEVAGFALALPTAAKVRGWAKKRLLRRAAAPLVPKAIVTGRKKGFSIPAAAWLRGPLEPFAREVLAPARVREQGLLDPAAVTRRARPPRGRRGGPQPPALGPDVAVAVAGPAGGQARPRTRSMSRPRTASPLARRPLCWYSLVIHGFRPRMRRPASRENSIGT